MKRLRFSEPLPQLVLSGKKDTTWRINDDKNISENDELSLCDINNNEFAKAKVLWTRETEFAKLSKKDLEGHEKFSSDEEMYKTYSKYYGIIVTPKTLVKIIKFSILKKASQDQIKNPAQVQRANV